MPPPRTSPSVRVIAGLVSLLVLLLAAPVAAEPFDDPPAAPAAVPVISQVAPLVGSTAGGELMSIYGSGFTGVTWVRFGPDAYASNVTVVNDTVVNVVIPPYGAPGLVNVFVHGPGGVSANTPTSHFYYQAPDLQSVTPSSGPTTGATEVTLKGFGFSSVTAVWFGNTKATSFDVVDPSTIVAISPARPLGVVDVTVWAGTGSSQPRTFTYAAAVAPVARGITPAYGPLSGGIPVEIIGSGFTGATKVKFSPGAQAPSFTVVSDNRIVAITPPVLVNTTLTVWVETPLGSSKGNPASCCMLFRFVGPAQVTAMAPTDGSVSGGTIVDLTGSNLGGATGVRFGDTPAASFQVMSATWIKAVAPPHGAGAVDVIVQGAGGESVPSAATAFEYLPSDPPAVTSVTPWIATTAEVDAGMSVTVRGTNLSATTSVRFGPKAAVAFVVVSDTEVWAVPPSYPGGTLANVFVTTADGTSGNARPSWFGYR